MLGQDNLTEATLSQLLNDIVLSEAIHRIEVFALRCIQRRLIFQVFHVLIKVLIAFGIEQPELLEAQSLNDIGKCCLLTGDLELQEQFILI